MRLFKLLILPTLLPGLIILSSVAADGIKDKAVVPPAINTDGIGEREEPKEVSQYPTLREARAPSILSVPQGRRDGCASVPISQNLGRSLNIPKLSTLRRFIASKDTVLIDTKDSSDGFRNETATQDMTVVIDKDKVIVHRRVGHIRTGVDESTWGKIKELFR